MLDSETRNAIERVTNYCLKVLQALTEQKATSEEIQREFLHEVRQINERLARGEAVQDITRQEVSAVREHTGAHPLQPLDLEDTDKTIGKAVRKVLPLVGKIFPWVATAGLGLWHVVEKLLK